MEQPCPPDGAHIRLWKSTVTRRHCRKLSNSAGVAQRIGRLEICKVSNCLAGGIKLLRSEVTAHTRLKGQHGLPGWFLLQSCQQLRRLLAETLNHAWIVSVSLALAGHRDRRIDATQALKGDHILGQRYQENSRRNGFAFQPGRQTAPIPTLEGLPKSLDDTLAKAEPLGETLGNFTKSGELFFHQRLRSQNPLRNRASQA